MAAPPETLLPPSSPDGRRSRRNVVIAGASPTRIPARRDMAKAQPRTREIEAHFVQTRQVARAEGTDEANARPRRAVVPIRPEMAARADAFGEQLPHDPSGTRSKRSANGHLARRERRCAPARGW